MPDTTNKTRWIECVPNFSEGRNRAVIDDICGCIEKAPGAKLLHVDIGEDAHRTVVTFVAPPNAALEAGFKAIAKASRLIDMRHQFGVHRRIGATDVFPFVPIGETDMATCVGLARRLGRRVWTALNIPVYLYGEAATSPARVRVPDIRGRGLESLKKRIKTPEFTPDFGDNRLPERTGATIIGARPILLAYNVNLTTRDVDIARRIAARLRSSGRIERERTGRIMRDSTGRAQRIPGRLQACQADGWYMAAYGLAQVTMNLMNHRETGLHTAYEAVREEAAAFGVNVAGSELIGMAPLSAMLDAGRYYGSSANNGTMSEGEWVAIAVEKLGLSSVSPFHAPTRIIDWRIAEAYGSAALR